MSGNTILNIQNALKILRNKVKNKKKPINEQEVKHLDMEGLSKIRNGLGNSVMSTVLNKLYDPPKQILFV